MGRAGADQRQIDRTGDFGELLGPRVGGKVGDHRPCAGLRGDRLDLGRRARAEDQFGRAA